MLSTPESATTSANSGKDSESSSKSLDTQNPLPVTTTTGFNVTDPCTATAGDHDVDRWAFHVDSPAAAAMEDFNFNSGIPMNNIEPSFTWEMIGLGLEEPLPPQETIDEL